MVLFGASLAISKNFQGCGFTHTSATTENEANGRFALKKNVKCSHEGSGVHKLKNKGTVTYCRELLLTRKEKYKTFIFLSGINQS